MITIKGVSLSKILEATLLLVFLSAVPAAAQNVLQGKVTDAKGQPLPGVMILISGTTNGTMTDLGFGGWGDEGTRDGDRVFSGFRI